MRAGTGFVLALAATLAACTEQPQTVNESGKKSDTRAYQGAANPFVDPNWKVGDSGSWEEQMRLRVQNQNEYIRVK